MKSFYIGLSDLLQGLKNFHIAWLYAWGDTKARYKRSILGPFWIVLTTLVSIAGLGYIWSLLFGMRPEELVPSLTLGLVVWQLLSSCILESSSIFIRFSSFIKNVPVPYSMFPLYLVARQFIYFLHAALVIVLVFIVFPSPISSVQLLIVPNLLILLINLFWIVFLFSLIGAKFRDFEQIISALMPMFFFLSPVIYKPNQITFSSLIIWLNPFTYMIALVRDPLLGVLPDPLIYVVSLLGMVVGSLLTLYVLGKSKAKLPFWV
jgi:ABC-type polysaccharide/polyol phosphate export permease